MRIIPRSILRAGCAQAFDEDADLQRDLIPVNAVIGFLKCDPQWPSLLYELGYRLVMLEQAVTVPNAGIAEVDIICLNHSKNHAILWECKSGRTIDPKQANVYAAMDAECVQRTGNVTFPKPASATVEVVYCCLAEDAKAVSAELMGNDIKLPVVSLGDKAELSSGQIKASDVYKTFMGGVTLPSLNLVPRFLLANTHTSKADLARPIFATVVSLLRRQVSRISPRQIFEETFNDWGCMGTDLRRYLVDQIKGIALELSKDELSDFAHIERAKHSPGDFFLVFTADILGRDASSRTRTFQKFAKLGAGYSERLRNNQPFEPSNGLEDGWLPGMGPKS
jgi:hypothetical protein